MKYHIQPSTLSGTLTIPPSKSHTLRSIIFGLMGNGKTTIHNYLHSPDTTAMLRAISLLGATVHTSADTLEIWGTNAQLSPAQDIIDAGNSGQILRFVGALASLSPSYTVLTGDHSIRHNRPITPLIDALRTLNVTAHSLGHKGHAPLLVKGPFQGGKTSIDGRDSQPVSGLIIAAAFAPYPTDIEVTSPGETPWIDLTLHWLDFLNIPYRRSHYTHYHIPGNSRYCGFTYTVPADFSSLAFPLAAALISQSSITIKNIDMEDIQGDKALIAILCQMGAKIAIKQQTICVTKTDTLTGISLDINQTIDALPILAVLGCYAMGKTHIFNGNIARHKECDRIHAIVTELKKMGANIEEYDDGIIVSQSTLQGACLWSHGDHRIALALAVAASRAIGQSTIDDVTCVHKTYSTFASDMQQLGMQIKEEL